MVVALQLIAVLTPACTDDLARATEEVRRTTESVLRDAIAELDSQPLQWQAVVDGSLFKLGQVSQDTLQRASQEMRELFAEVNRDLRLTLDHAVALVGVEFRCNVDFLGLRVSDTLRYILDRFLKNPNPRLPIPWVCHFVPDRVQLSRTATAFEARAPYDLVSIYGFNFSYLGLPAVNLSNSVGQMIRQSRVTPVISSAYQLQLNLQTEDFAGAEPGSTLTVVWPGNPEARAIPIVLPQSPADLVIDSQTIDPPSPTERKNAHAAITVRNAGAGPAGEFSLQWKPEGTDPGITLEVSGLFAGQSQTFGFDYTYPRAMNTNAVAVADSQNDIQEADEGNNSRTTAVSVTARTAELVCDKDITVKESDFDVDTGCDVQPGDRVSFAAWGSIWAGVWLTGENGPGGWGTTPNDQAYPKFNANSFSLLAKTDEYFYVGEAAEYVHHSTKPTRRLYLRINDNVPGNGSGEFVCSVEIWRLPA
jgi:hypothetical protein